MLTFEFGTDDRHGALALDVGLKRSQHHVCDLGLAMGTHNDVAWTLRSGHSGPWLVAKSTMVLRLPHFTPSSRRRLHSRPLRLLSVPHAPMSPPLRHLPRRMEALAVAIPAGPLGAAAPAGEHAAELERGFGAVSPCNKCTGVTIAARACSRPNRCLSSSSSRSASRSARIVGSRAAAMRWETDQPATGLRLRAGLSARTLASSIETPFLLKDARQPRPEHGKDPAVHTVAMAARWGGKESSRLALVL